MFRRKAFHALLAQKDSRKISLLIGPRQVGKTTLLEQLFEEICTNQKAMGISLDLDVISDLEKVASFESTLNLLKLNGYEEKQKDFFYLFLDEAQRHPPMGKIMKNIYDHLPNVKIYASGSSSIALKEQAQESLAGRKNIFYIYPLDFEEFLLFRGKAELLKQLPNTSKLKGKNLDKSAAPFLAMLEEFLIFGGYPEVVLQKDEAGKRTALESIFDLYIKRDLVGYLKIEDILKVKKMIEYLAIQHGQKIEYSTMAAACGLKVADALNYSEVLEETHIIQTLRPFFSNKNKEMVKMPKCYFLDSGVRNYFINNFNPLRLREDDGFLFEGYVLSQMLKSGILAEEMRFWQDKNMHEVDLVIAKAVPVSIEVKHKRQLKADDFSGLRHFGENYPNVKKAYLVNLGVQEKGEMCEMVLPYCQFWD